MYIRLTDASAVNQNPQIHMELPDFHAPSHALRFWLQEKNITPYQLVKDTLLTQSKVSEILAGKRRVTAETATVLGAYFGNGADYWLGIQSRSDLLKANADAALPFESRGDLGIGGFVMRCYVLADETRVVSAQSFFVFFGINQVRVGTDRLSRILDNPLLRSASMDAIRQKIARPIPVADERGLVVLCYEGELIIDFCRALLDLRRIPDALPQWAQSYATKAEIIVSSIAKVGITALIDEATGHQARRHREALQILLDTYFRKEKYGVWTKRFPDWFYEEIFRLNGWKWESIRDTKRPPYIGKITRDIVYARLERGVITELERRNPLLPTGSRKVKHHQWLSDELGHPALTSHFYALKGLFRMHRSWKSFYHALQLAHPKKNELVQLEFGDLEESPE
jgi:addiction module HigA family antidote